MLKKFRRLKRRLQELLGIYYIDKRYGRKDFDNGKED